MKRHEVIIVNQGAAERREVLFKRDFHSYEFVAFTKGRSCCTCGRPSQVQCAHVRSRRQLAGYKENIVPLCLTCHLLLDTKLGRRLFEERFGVDLELKAVEHWRSWCEFSGEDPDA